MSTLVPILGVAAVIAGVLFLVRKFVRRPAAEIWTAIALVPDRLVRFIAEAIDGLVTSGNRVAASGFRHVVGGGWGPARFLGALVATGLWVVAFNLVRSLDFETLVALGHTPAVAAQLTTLLVMASSAVGLVLSELVGLTKVLPLHGAHRWVRAAVGTVAMAMFGVVVWAQWKIGTERAAQYAGAKLLAARASGRLDADPELATALAREASVAHLLDGAVAVGATILEAVTSWGVLVATLVMAMAALWLLTIPLRALGFGLRLLCLLINRVWQVPMAAFGASTETIIPEAVDSSSRRQAAASPPPGPRPRPATAQHPPRADEASGTRTTTGSDSRWRGV